VAEGAIFRPINRRGQLRVALFSGDAVSGVIGKCLVAASIDPKGDSGRPLRAGFSASAAQAGAPTLKIRARTRHAAGSAR